MPPHPTIQSERLTLRPFDPADAAVVAALCDDREVAANTLFIPHPYRLADAEAWIAGQQEAFDSSGHVHFAITKRDSGDLIGAVGLMVERDHDRAEIGYWIGRPYWNHGFATEAARAAIRYAFETAGLNRVAAFHFGRNPASGRVMQNAGMIREGLLRQHIRKWDRYEDCPTYGLIRADYDAARTR